MKIKQESDRLEEGKQQKCQQDKWTGVQEKKEISREEKEGTERLEIQEDRREDNEAEETGCWERKK